MHLPLLALCVCARARACVGPIALADRYAAKTENERIQQAIAARGVVAGADTRWDATAVHASWRQEDKRQWKGQLFRSMSTPTDLRLQSVSGARVARPNSCLETFTPPIAALLRERIPDREVPYRCSCPRVACRTLRVNATCAPLCVLAAASSQLLCGVWPVQVGPLFYATVRRGDRVPPAAGSTEDKWRTRRARSAQASVSRRVRPRPKSRDQGSPGGARGDSGVRARTPSTRQRVLTQGGADRPRTADSGASPTSAGVRRVSRGGLEFSLRRHRSLRGGSGNAPTPKAASGARRLGLAEQAAPLNDGAAPNRATGLATSASAPVVGSGRHADDASARRRQRGAAAAPVSQVPTTGAAQGEGRETGEALSLNGKLRLNIGSVGAGLGQPGTPGRDSMREGNNPRMATTFAVDMDDADGVEPGSAPFGYGTAPGRGGTAAMVRRLYTQSIRSDSKSCAAMRTLRQQRHDS